MASGSGSSGHGGSRLKASTKASRRGEKRSSNRTRRGTNGTSNTNRDYLYPDIPF